MKPADFSTTYSFLEGFKAADACVRYGAKADALAGEIAQRADHHFTRGVVACLVASATATQPSKDDK